MSIFDRRDTPKAHSFTVGTCGDPNCGPHVIALDAAGNAMVDIVLSHDSALHMIRQVQAILYKKVSRE